MYGGDDIQVFRDGIKNSAYGKMLRLVKNMWQQAHLPFDANNTSALVTWCLLGSYHTEDLHTACPAHRFVRVCNHVRKEGIRDITNTVGLLESFSTWSKKLGLSTVEEGLVSTHKTLNDLRGNVEQLFGYPAFPRETSELLFRIVDSICKASVHMIEEFRRDPFAYVKPHRYIENPKAFVRPLLRIMFHGHSLSASVEELDKMERRGYIVQWGRQKDDRTLILSLIIPLAGDWVEFLSKQDVDTISTLIGMADFLFVTKSRTRTEVKVPGELMCNLARLQPIDLTTGLTHKF